MLKLCIWMNIPSHYQTTFFEALVEHESIDLQVIYLSGSSESRAAEGWSDEHARKPYEHFASNGSTPEELAEVVPEFRKRIHLISAYFSPLVVRWLCDHRVKWCHWSEMPGIRLAELLHYRMRLFKQLYPLFMKIKKSEGERIRNYALGAFGQGELARKAFRQMGIPENRIADLYYAPSGLKPMAPAEEIVLFARGRKVLLSVGALCRRKGTDILIKAAARLPADWCLVLCGLDRNEGADRRLVEKLGISDRVLLTGAWPANRIAEVYAAADLFVLASRFDGWGAVLNEAASMGLPLIATDTCGAAWHLVRPGVNGSRARADSVKAVSAVIDHYCTNSDLLKVHGESSAELFYSGFTPSQNAQRLLDALQKWI